MSKKISQALVKAGIDPRITRSSDHDRRPRRLSEGLISDPNTIKLAGSVATKAAPITASSIRSIPFFDIPTMSMAACRNNGATSRVVGNSGPARQS